MVELVDDDHVEVARIQVIKVRPVQALDRREHMVEMLWTFSAKPLFSKVRIKENLLERVVALFEDLPPVSQEQQSGRTKLGLQRPIVERCHHGLAGARSRDEKIPVMPKAS